MSDWTSGYVADIGYTFGYYTELNPVNARLAFLNAGLVPPSEGVHCELGFGQGVSVNVHAAAGASTWYGTDFNPAQAGFAQSLAQASGAAAHLVDQAFADFCNRSDLPPFDSIGLHGIWSWISDENRAHITHLIAHKLKVGGVVYISYNTQPGWAAMVPLRDLLTEHASTLGAPGQGIVGRINAALEFTDQLFAANPAFVRANPLVAERVTKLKEQNRNYLAHEYFNRDWLPMPFSRMAQWLTPTKLEYACSAALLSHIDPLNLSAEQQVLLQAVPDAMFRETVRDFCVNQQFRKDYWIKGARRMSALERTEALRATKVLLIAHRPDVSLKVSGALGESSMSEAVYTPLLDLLADHKPRTLGQLELALKDKGVILAQLVQAALILTGAGHLATVQDEATTAKAKKATDKLNSCLMGKARSSGDISFLASPVTGGGVTVGRFQQLFLMARAQGAKQPADWAHITWELLQAQGQRILKDGQTLQSPEENLAELNTQAQAFADKLLPILKALQIA